MFMCSLGNIYFLFPSPSTKFEKACFLDVIFWGQCSFFPLFSEGVKILCGDFLLDSLTRWAIGFSFSSY